MAADYSRIHRLLRIITLIQSDGDWSAQRLAQECKVTPRTIYRDLNMLEGAGIPYFFDEMTHGYRIRRDFFMPPVELTLDESLALVALGEHIGGREQIPLTRAAARAMGKIRSQLPASIRDELEQLDRHVVIELARSGPHEGIADVYERMRAAILRKRALTCKYESVERSLRNQRDNERFEFHPYALFFSQRAWYVLGHHAGRGEIRCLKLNRFTAIEQTTRPYAVPDDFSLDDHLGNAWRMIRGGRSYNVELVFEPAFAETIADTRWHATQKVDWQPDGSIVFRCTVDGLDEVVWWVLSMGPHCIVRKPKALADRVRKLARETLDCYEGQARAR
jgi:proteasome accessory factor B